MTKLRYPEEILSERVKTLAALLTEREADKARIAALEAHLHGALETLRDAEVCGEDCQPCNAARTILEQKP